jgi:NitT/TauT family transport system substrate-binding protein
VSAAIVQRAQGLPYLIVASTSHTSPTQRVFGLVTRPGSSAKNLADLKGATLAVAARTMVDYMTDVFLTKAGLPLDHFDRREVPKIPIRVQTLIAGRLDAAVLPEPLLSLVEKAGGLVVMDDTDLNMPLAAVALRADRVDPTVVGALRRAMGKAVAWVNEDPVRTRELMTETGLIPPSLSDWTPPKYDPVDVPDVLPDRALYDSYVEWLVRNEVLGPPGSAGRLKAAPAYEEVILTEVGDGQ